MAVIVVTRAVIVYTRGCTCKPYKPRFTSLFACLLACVSGLSLDIGSVLVVDTSPLLDILSSIAYSVVYPELIIRWCCCLNEGVVTDFNFTTALVGL